MILAYWMAEGAPHNAICIWVSNGLHTAHKPKPSFSGFSARDLKPSNQDRTGTGRCANNGPFAELWYPGHRVFTRVQGIRVITASQSRLALALILFDMTKAARASKGLRPRSAAKTRLPLPSGTSLGLNFSPWDVGSTSVTDILKLTFLHPEKCRPRAL